MNDIQMLLSMKKLRMYIIQQLFFKHTSRYLVLLLEPYYIKIEENARTSGYWLWWFE